MSHNCTSSDRRHSHSKREHSESPRQRHQHNHEECEEDDDGPALNIKEEQSSYLRIESSFQEYEEYAMRIVQDKRSNYNKLQERHKAILPQYELHFNEMERCVRANVRFIQDIISYSSHHMFTAYWPEGSIVDHVEAPTALDMDKVLSTLRQFVRDWAVEGLPEREACYTPLLQKLEECFPERKGRQEIKVLIPGSGLSRLAYEVFARGFFSQGSEFSHHMLICGSYVLNRIPISNCYTIYPFVTNVTNNRNREDPLRPITVPDVSPIEACERNLIKDNGCFSMCAGDFLEVYNRQREREAWNAILTCFFIDTAHNIFEYVETISKALKPGGVWINIGPLLWHFADQLGEMSIDLAWDDVRKIIVAYGFDIKEERDVPCTYTTNSKGLMKQQYTAIYFFAVKKAL